jgi:carbon monoxide dehydrogenase subunit G
MSVNVSESVDVAAPAEDVFAALTDWSGQGDWMFATSVRPTRGYGRQDGDEITARTGIGPIGFTDTMTITQWDPPNVCRVRHTGKLVRGTAVFAVAADGPDRSRVEWTEELDIPFGRLGAIGFVFGRPVFTFFVRLSLRRFAAQVVGQPAPEQR